MYYCNSLLLNLPATQTNRLQLVLNSAARAVTKTPKFHHITPILKSPLAQDKWENKIQGSLFHILISQNFLTSALFFHSLHIVLLGLPLLSTFVALLSPIVLNSKAKRYYYHSAPVLWNNLPSHLRHVAHNVTPPILNSPVSDLSKIIAGFKAKWYDWLRCKVFDNIIMHVIPMCYKWSILHGIVNANVKLIWHYISS